MLQSPAGAALLAELETVDLSEANTLRLLTALRKHHPADLAAAALETTRLRLKGHAKFGERAATMFFTRDALEQATDQRISRYRFGSAHLQGQIAGDFGCSIGGDTLALAESTVEQVVGVDLDPLRLAIARVNVPSAQFIQADLAHPLPFSDKLRFAFFDPARRFEDGRRIFSVHDYLPSLDVIDLWPRLHLMIKLSPGVNVDELKGYGGRLEFISLEGDLKEAVLHLPAAPESCATLIHADGTFNQMRRALDQAEPQIAVTPPRAVLYEPDPAVIRAGLVQDLGAQIGATLIDPTIAFMTADQLTATPFARAWQIEDWLPFNLKKLRAYLRDRGVGRVTVKKRGSPITPEELIAKLRLPGEGEERVIVLTRVQGEPAIIVANYFT